MNSAPNDHFTAGPHCRVNVSGCGALIMLVAVQLSVLGIVSARRCSKVLLHAKGSAPDDHFTAGPHCRVNVSGCRER